MKNTRTLITAAGIALLMPLAGSALASDDDSVRCGRELMTQEEFAEHRARMWNLPPAEREAYREAHHEAMEARAAAQGVTLPDEPRSQGQGRGPGPGQGLGKGLARAGYERPCPGPGYGPRGGGYVDD